MSDIEELVREIPLDQLRDSPFQPRHDYKNLQSLADNIKAEGRIHQPLVVRCVMVDPAAKRPEDMFAPGYEIVFGHRRKRGGGLAGLATVPCIVRAMTDAEVRAAQMAENVQRENMAALEEAAGYQAQMDADGLSAGALAERIGLSKSHVLSRLLLLSLVPEARQLLESGQMGSETALLIARLRHPALQTKALARVRSKWGGNSNLLDGGKASFRAVRELLADEFTLQLKGAIFDREDPALVPAAGVCSTCPKRSGNAPEWQDIAQLEHHFRQCGPDLCTDPDCFAEKKKAHLAAQAKALEEAGKTVITGNKAKAALDQYGKVKDSGAFIELKDAQTHIKGLSKGAATVPVVLILDQKSGKTVRAVAKAALVEAGVNLDKPKPAQGRGQQDWEKERARKAAAAEVETAARKNLAAAVFAVASNSQRMLDEARLVAHRMLEDLDDAEAQQLLGVLFKLDDARELFDALETMNSNQVGLVMLAVLMVNRVVVNGYDYHLPCSELNTLAELYGIDIEAARAGTLAVVAADPASTPSTAARAAGKAKSAPAGAGKATSGGAARAGGKTAKKKEGLTIEEWASAHAAEARVMQKVKDDAGGAGERAGGRSDE